MVSIRRPRKGKQGAPETKGSRVSGGRQKWAVGQGKTQVDINGAIPGFRLAGRCP